MAPSMGPNSKLDYFDFSLDLSGRAQGTITVIDIPYIDSLFVPYSSQTVVQNLGTILASESPPFSAALFAGEVFKLLYISVSMDDLVRETPASINLQAAYTVAGLSRMLKFVYYTMIAGQPVFTGYFGNVAFAGQYGPLPLIGSIDTTKLVNVVMDSTGTIDYYVVRVDTTPNVIVTNGVSQSMGLTDSYTINGVSYVLTATANGVMGIGFYATLNVSSDLDPSITDNGFVLEPASSIVGYTMVQLSPTSYRFLIQPKPNLMSMDLKIVFKGPTL